MLRERSGKTSPDEGHKLGLKIAQGSELDKEGWGRVGGQPGLRPDGESNQVSFK